MCLALGSSWYGAVLYVKHYPMLIQYLSPMELRGTDGQELTQASTSTPTPFVMHALARRQPYQCWGTYVYYLINETTLYQFPTVRSVGLTEHAHDILIRNFFVIPAGLPLGTYHLRVTVFPSCDGMDIHPSTLDLNKAITIVP